MAAVVVVGVKYDLMNDVCLVREDFGPRSGVPSSPRDSGVTHREEKPTRRHRCNKTSEAFFFLLLCSS